MKGTKLLLISLFSAGLLFSLLLWNFPSWSASDGSSLEPFLKLTLSTIILSLWSVSYTHLKASKVMLNIKGVDIRLRHLDRITALLFVGVLAFGVNEIAILHFIFIILAAAGIFIRIVNYYENKIYKTIGIVGIAIASFTWIVGFLFPMFWSIGTGEMIFYLVAAFSIIAQLKEIE